jgi:hypothetical protein
VKVDVLQVQDAKFNSGFSWWSDWVDVCIYDFESTPFLLQMSVSRTNKKKFRNARISGTFAYRQVRSSAIGDLVQMSSKPYADID